MKKVIACAVISMALCSGVQAKGDAAAGQQKAVTCTACHGSDGVSPAPQWPNIAGQGEKYLIKQITAIKNGERNVPTMMPFVTDLTEQDIEDLAAHFNAQTPALGATDPQYVELGESIFRAGIPSKNVPACAGCHAPDGQGNYLAVFPSLAGQKPQYIIESLQKYQTDERVVDEQSAIMVTISKKLLEKEMEAVANYIHGLR